MKKIKKTIRRILILITELGFPLTLVSTLWLRIVRRVGIGKLTDGIFMTVGILPVQDHYYQPLINPKKHLSKSLRKDRHLPGIDLNVEDQIDVLNKFNYTEELLRIPITKTNLLEFYYDNNSYESGVLNIYTTS